MPLHTLSARLGLLATLAGLLLTAGQAAPQEVKSPKKGGKGLRPGEVNAPAAKGERKQDRLKPGDPAPDFTLPDLAGKHEVTLSALRGKPVVLIFGSYT
jgi:hypothetical protein